NLAERRHERLDRAGRRRTNRHRNGEQPAGVARDQRARGHRCAGRIWLAAAARFRRGVMIMGPRLAAMLMVAATMTIAGDAGAQTRAAGSDALRAGIERRFEVLPLRNGIALRPKTP